MERRVAETVCKWQGQILPGVTARSYMVWSWMGAEDEAKDEDVDGEVGLVWFSCRSWYACWEEGCWAWVGAQSDCWWGRLKTFGCGWWCYCFTNEEEEHGSVSGSLPLFALKKKKSININTLEFSWGDTNSLQWPFHPLMQRLAHVWTACWHFGHT